MIRRVVSVDTCDAVVDTGRASQRIEWHVLRAAASQEDAVLRAVYAAILADARRLAASRGLSACRVESPGLYQSPLYAEQADAQAYLAMHERDWRRLVRNDYNLHEGAVIAEVVALDPDQAAACRWEPRTRTVVYL